MRARAVGAATLALLLTSVLTASCGSGGASAGRPGFVAHDTRGLVLDGDGVALTGINIYNAASRGNCWYDMRDRLGGALDRVLEASDGRANVIRVWFFQSLATRDGRRDWTELDRVLATARAKGVRVIAVLTDQWGACEGARGAGAPYKDVGWYTDGYKRPDPGGTVSYRDWAREVATRYRDDPTVALWSLVNEAEAGTRRSGPCPPGAARALAGFTDDVSAVVKDADPDHLLGLGTIGGGQCGAVGPEYAQLHASPRIDVCEYHDYDLPSLPGDRSNGLLTRIRECAGLGKPLLVGESGVVPDDVGGLPERAEVFRRKIDAQVGAGVAGFLLWGWSDGGYGPDDEYGIGPGDPSLAVLGVE